MKHIFEVRYYDTLGISNSRTVKIKAKDILEATIEATRRANKRVAYKVSSVIQSQ